MNKELEGQDFISDKFEELHKQLLVESKKLEAIESGVTSGIKQVKGHMNEDIKKGDIIDFTGMVAEGEPTEWEVFKEKTPTGMLDLRSIGEGKTQYKRITYDLKVNQPLVEQVGVIMNLIEELEKERMSVVEAEHAPTEEKE